MCHPGRQIFHLHKCKFWTFDTNTNTNINTNINVNTNTCTNKKDTNDVDDCAILATKYFICTNASSKLTNTNTNINFNSKPYTNQKDTNDVQDSAVKQANIKFAQMQLPTQM